MRFYSTYPQSHLGLWIDVDNLFIDFTKIERRIVSLPTITVDCESISDFDPIRAEIELGIRQFHALLSQGPAAFALALQQPMQPSLAAAIRDRVFYGPTREERIRTTEPIRGTGYAKSTCENPGATAIAILDDMLLRLGALPVRANALRAMESAGIAPGTARYSWTSWLENVRTDVDAYRNRISLGHSMPVPTYDTNTVENAAKVSTRRKERREYLWKPVTNPRRDTP